MERNEVNKILTNEQKALANILEKEFGLYFDIEKGGEVSVELSGYTNGGVNMIIYLDPFTLDEFEKYIENFDIDNEIDLCRQDSSYRDAFSIRDSVEDFEDWIEKLKGLIGDVEELTEDSEDICYEYCPHCDTEVELDHDLRVQICPNCGKRIVPCSICPLKDCVKPCPLEKQAQIENGEKDYEDED